MSKLKWNASMGGDEEATGHKHIFNIGKVLGKYRLQTCQRDGRRVNYRSRRERGDFFTVLRAKEKAEEINDQDNPL